MWRHNARVYLVGAGPGDPDLLTVKALRLIQQADVIVYDRLVSEEILDLIPVGTARIFVGKAAGQHHMPQEDINDLLVRLARTGHRVVRLKGGDPFVFGRGSEEAAYLTRHGIGVAVVPGITAASGVSAATGIPLTHRGYATGVRFVTGHCRAGTALDLDWKSLADPDTTLIIYMGLAHLPEIAHQLAAAGLSPQTPAAAVSRGTTRDQQVCAATLETMSEAVAKAVLPSPTLIIVGQVVSLADVLDLATDFAEPAVTQSPEAARAFA